MKRIQSKDAFLCYNRETRRLELAIYGERGGQYRFELSLDRSMLSCAIRQLCARFGEVVEAEQQSLRSAVDAVQRAANDAKRQWEGA